MVVNGIVRGVAYPRLIYFTRLAHYIYIIY